MRELPCEISTFQCSCMATLSNFECLPRCSRPLYCRARNCEIMSGYKCCMRMHETQLSIINHGRRPSPSTASTATPGSDKATATIVWNSRSMDVYGMQYGANLCPVFALRHVLSYVSDCFSAWHLSSRSFFVS